MPGSGIRAEVSVTGPTVCRIVDASTSVDVVSVSRSAPSTSDDVTVEFTADAGDPACDVTEVFSYDGRSVYRFERPTTTEPACACDLIECQGYPVRHMEVNTGTVVLSFVAADIESLRAVITALKDRYDVSLECLTRSASVREGNDLVFVDRSVLTDRQREVLATAHEMGYFEHPKQANAEEVAAALDINGSTFAEHLSAAHSKLLDAVLNE